MNSLAGKLLVAGPDLGDAHFKRSVVFIASHSEQGAFGLIINRPIEDEPVIKHVPAFAPFVSSPAVLHQGGPVEPSAVFALSRWPGEDEPEGWTRLHGEIGLLDLNSGPTELVPRLLGLRLFAGYAGWGAGQLDAEMAQGAWFAINCVLDELFARDPGALYRETLRRQRGVVAIHAFFPDDPRLN